MEKFDVFLCHNTKDKPAVIKVAEQLKQCGIVPWLDIWHLRPGFSWQRALEQQIDNLVYKLYELTYQEVKIIDPEFKLTESEYEEIKIE